MDTVLGDVSMDLSGRPYEPTLLTQTHLGFLHEDDPGWKASDALFDDFLAGVLHCGADGDERGAAVSLAAFAARTCEQQADILRRLLARANGRSARTKAVSAALHEELFTWRLVALLYEDRLHVQQEQMRQEDEDELPPIDDRSAHEYLRSTDKGYREMDIILNWLRANAYNLFDEESVNERFAKKSLMWEKSLRKLHSGDKSALSSFHPDAPLEGRILAEDQEEEQKLLLTLFQYVRCGKFREAANLCISCGQSWRAGQLLCATELFADENAQRTDGAELDEDGGELKPLVGNQARRFTKAVMWTACEHASLCGEERALYGALSGRLSAVLPMCCNAQDTLWAYVLCAMEYRLDARLRHVHDAWQRLGTDDDYASLPCGSDDQCDMTLADIVNELVAHEAARDGNKQGRRRRSDIVNRSRMLDTDVDMDDEAADNSRRRSLGDVCNPYERMQQHVMLDDARGLLDFMADCLRANDVQPCGDVIGGEVHSAGRHFVRCAAHLALVLAAMRADFDADSATAIMSQYVGHLIEDGRLELAPHYIHELPPAERVASLALLFARADPVDRANVLQAARSADLDVDAAAVRCVLDARRAHARTADHASESALLSQFEWLFIDDSLRLDVLRQGCAIVTYLLGSERVSSAQVVFDRLSVSAAVESVRRRWGDDERAIPPADGNALKRWLGYDAYFCARRAYDVWRTAVDTSVPGVADSTDDEAEVDEGPEERELRTAAAEQRRRAIADREDRIALAAQAAVDAFQRVLLFPAGFLLDIADEPADTMDEWARPESIGAVRSSLVFEVAAMYASVLARSQQYNLCLRLADLLASVRLSLYKMFTAEQVGALVTMLADCALQAIEDRVDPFQGGQSRAAHSSSSQ